MNGVSFSLTLPTIWVHRCSVAQVSLQLASGSSGQADRKSLMRTSDGWKGRSARRDEYVELQALDFLLADVLADFLVELRPGLPRPILHQLGGHARTDPGNQEEFLARAGVEIDLHECRAIELARLFRRELLVDEIFVEID